MAAFVDIPGFEDFDDKVVYDCYEKALLHAETLNFVIQFDDKNATSARNIGRLNLKKVLERDQPTKSFTRWINIFGPERQKDLVKELSACYRFTPRLLGLMCSDHQTPVPLPPSPVQHGIVQAKAQVVPHSRSAESTSSDLEKNYREISDEIRYPTFDMSHYKMADEVWHYNSVDWGPKCKWHSQLPMSLLTIEDLCIGYNSLADTSRILGQRDTDLEEASNEGRVHSNNKPKGARTWTWLVLCDDGKHPAQSTQCAF